MTNKISITEIEPPTTWTPIDFPYKNKDGIIEGNKKHLNTYFCDECDYSTNNRYDFENFFATLNSYNLEELFSANTWVTKYETCQDNLAGACKESLQLQKMKTARK